MKRVFLIVTAIVIASLNMIAAEGELQFQLQAMGAKGMVMGMPVKNSPYSAEEVSNADQTLGDGKDGRWTVQNGTRLGENEGRGSQERKSGPSNDGGCPGRGSSYDRDSGTRLDRQRPGDCHGVGTLVFTRSSDHDSN